MYPAFDAAPWPLALMRFAVGSRLSGRARGSAFFSGFTNPGLTGHAITSENTFADSWKLSLQGEMWRTRPREAWFDPLIEAFD
jgi:hypothetical protein